MSFNAKPGQLSTIQLIGGQFKGKKIPILDLGGLRPTPNRVRETLFNWLMNTIQDMHCLDAFAGSGALGFEALSRGASQVTFLEQNPLIAQHIKTTALSFSKPLYPSQVEINTTDAIQYLKTTPKTFNLIFLDPPFNEDKLMPCLNVLTERALLSKEGLIYVESNLPLPNLEPRFQCIKSKKAGQVYFGLYMEANQSHDCQGVVEPCHDFEPPFVIE